MKKLFGFLVLFSVILSLQFQVLAGPGAKAIDFTLKGVSGETYSFSDFKDKKPVILFFWTSWCPHCRNQFPGLSNEYQKIKSKGIELLAVNSGESSDKVKNFAQKNSVFFPVILDEYQILSEGYSIKGIPAYILINKKGEVVFDGHSLPSDYEKILK